MAMYADSGSASPNAPAVSHFRRASASQPAPSAWPPARESTILDGGGDLRTARLPTHALADSGAGPMSTVALDLICFISASDLSVQRFTDEMTGFIGMPSRISASSAALYTSALVGEPIRSTSRSCGGGPDSPRYRAAQEPKMSMWSTPANPAKAPSITWCGPTAPRTISVRGPTSLFVALARTSSARPCRRQVRTSAVTSRETSSDTVVSAIAVRRDSSVIVCSRSGFSSVAARISACAVLRNTGKRAGGLLRINR